jgi:hypothetical protein
LTGTKTGGACNAFPGGSTSGCVTFAPATGATVTLASLQVQASYVRLQNMTVTGSLDIVDAACAAGQPRDVVLQNMTGATFFVSGGQNVAIVGGSFGGVTNAQSSIQACGDYYVGTYASNVLVDSVRFHDDVWTNSAIHMECLHVSSVSGLSVINSRFENCGVFDIGVNNVNLNGRLVLAGDYFDDARGLNSATSGGSAAIGLSPGEWHLLHNVFAPGAGVADEVYGRTGDTYPNSELGYNVHSDSIQQFFCGAYALAAIQVHNETWGQGGVACGTGSALSSAALPTPPHVLPDGSLG